RAREEGVGVDLARQLEPDEEPPGRASEGHAGRRVIAQRSEHRVPALAIRGARAGNRRVEARRRDLRDQTLVEGGGVEIRRLLDQRERANERGGSADVADTERGRERLRERPAMERARRLDGARARSIERGDRRERLALEA